MKTTKSDRAKPAASTPAKKRWHRPRLTFQKDSGAIHDHLAPDEIIAKRSQGKRTSR